MGTQLIRAAFIAAIVALFGCDAGNGKRTIISKDESAARQECNDGDPNAGEEEILDGIDNDCDGQTDEGFDQFGEPCNVGIGACEREGVMGPTADRTALECEDPETGDPLQPFAPEAEACNNIDDDCDGATDEDFREELQLGTACERGVGECAVEGVRACNAQGGIVCDAAPGPLPEVETCNGLDDDCDGTSDEDFVTLGDACSDGVGACQTSGEFVCNAAGNGVVCNAVAGNGTAELCDDIDNDCDGEIDETFNLDEPCNVGVGACAVEGSRVCDPRDPSAPALCLGEPDLPSEETCDGIDNDCDGLIDDGFRLGEACVFGVGECSVQGVVVCGNGGVSVCVQNGVEPGQPSNELCNGLDDDCDGETDETFNLGGACTVGEGACERPGVFACAANGVECVGNPGQPSNELFNGIDDDCDGIVDEVLCNDIDGNCRPPCGPNRTCTNGWVCRNFVAQGFETCVPAGLPVDHIPVCQVPNAPDNVTPVAELICTYCQDRNANGACNSVEFIGNCQDGFDSDGDNLPDMTDPNCTNPPVEVCDGRDNNGDGETDENNPCPQGEICESGRCMIAAECVIAADCEAGELCDEGVCRRATCPGDFQCAQGQACVNGACVNLPPAGCASSDECEAGELCDEGVCRRAICPGDFQCAQGQACVNGACVNQPPAPRNDSDGDGVAACVDGVINAGCDCDDDVSDVMGPASMCRKANGSLTLYINFRANGEGNRPTCRAGETLVRRTDGSVLNGPQQTRDTVDGFDNTCDGVLDEGGPEACTWISIQDGSGIVGVAGQVWEASCPWYAPPPAP